MQKYIRFVSAGVLHDEVAILKALESVDTPKGGYITPTHSTHIWKRSPTKILNVEPDDPHLLIATTPETETLDLEIKPGVSEVESTFRLKAF